MIVSSKAFAAIVLLVISQNAFALGKNRTNSYEEKNMSVARWSDFGKDLAMDVYHKDGNIVAKMNVPGVDANNIQVHIKDGNLHVSGTREERKEVESKNYYHKEIKHGSFSRVISLPENIDADAMEWELSDGVLTVTIPKK